MVNISGQVETADNAAVVVSLARLCLQILPTAALPSAIIHAREKRAMMLPLTEAIAIVVFVNLARIAVQVATAMVARGLDFVLSSSRRGKALPFDVASAIATGYANLRGPFFERLTAHRARADFLSAAIIPIELAPVLMAVYKARLLAWVSRLSHWFTATARAKNLIGHVSSLQNQCKSIIPAMNSCVKYQTTLSA